MSLRAGELQVPFRLERPVQSTVAGKATPTWVDYGMVWGELEGLTTPNRGGITAEAEYRIVLRYRADVSPRWRLRYGARRFSLLSVVPDARRIRLTALAFEVVE